MKVHTYFVIPLVTVFLLFSCDLFLNDTGDKESDDPDQREEETELVVLPRDLMSDNINTMIEDGESIMMDTLETYSGMEDTGIYGAFVYISDYNMFPDGWDGEKTFYDRMEEVYWAEDNVVQLYYQMDDSTSGRGGIQNLESNERVAALALTSFIVGTAISVADTAIDTYQKHRELELDEERNRILRANSHQLRNMSAMMHTQNRAIMEEFQGVNSILADVQSGQAELSEQIYALEENLSLRLNSLNLNIDSFRNEMRQELSNVNERIDTVIEGLYYVGRDISLMHADLESSLDWISNYLLSNNLQTTMNSVNGFLRDYDDSVTWEQAQALASDYITYYETLILNFLFSAQDMQTYALENDIYADTILSDIQQNGSDSFVTFYRAKVAGTYYDTADHATEDFDEYYYFDYTNPRKSLEISYGNLEYLYKVMMTRFILNNILYAGEELKETNTSKATRYLEDISFIQTAAEEASLLMDTEHNTHQELIQNDFSSIYEDNSTRSDVVIDSFSYQKYSFDAEDWVSLTPEELSNLGDLVEESFTESYLEYLGMYMSELFALEVDLRSYKSE